jgi:Bacterial Ig domain
LANTLTHGGALAAALVVCALASSATGVRAQSTSALPSGWTSQDIGNPSVAGSASASSGTFTVRGSGTIAGTTDRFHFVYQKVQGDVEIIARVASLQNTTSLSKAGVMIRRSLDDRARQNAFMFATAGNGWNFQRRLVTDGTTYSTPGPIGTAPGWVRLVREGSLFTAYQSTDGSTWTLVGADTLSYLPSMMYVGLAVTSSSNSATATATFTNVVVRPYNPGKNQAPTVTLSSPSAWATFTAPANITLTAAASDADGSVSRVDFYYGSQLISSDTSSPFSATWNSAPAGTYSLCARATDNDGATATSPTVSVTVSPPTNNPPSVSITSPAAGASFMAPANVSITASASDSDGTVAVVDFYQGSTLIGSDASSPYSMTWSNVAAGSYQLTARVRDDDGATKTSTAIGVTVNPGTNQPPSVAISSPASGSTFTAPATIGIQATASDSDGSVTRVDFYRGSTLIASDTSSPYSATWTSAPTGTYTLTAVARDDDGATRTSSGVNITVNTTPNSPPTVSITSPASGATFAAPASLTINATAADSDGTIARVDFYGGSQLIATDTASPFSGTWTGVAAGSYALTAVARDNAGATRTSNAVSITVTAALATPTTVVFVPSPDHATAVTSYSVALRRASDSVTATPVATRDLGKPAIVNNLISVNISTLVDPLPAGSYYAVVSAIGPGGTSASAPSPAFTK